MIGLRFVLPDSLERDLLISKLFTRGSNTADAPISAGKALVAMLGAIVTLKSRSSEGPSSPEPVTPAAAAKMPAEALLLPPKTRTVDLRQVAAEREALVA
jgi:hypothetical protein